MDGQTLTLIATPLAPFLAGMLAFARLVPNPMPLVALSAVPAIVAGLAASGDGAILSGLLFGTVLGLPAPLAPLLLALAVLWAAAALHAHGTMAADRQGQRFAACYAFAMAGSLGVMVAQDLVAFYTSFSVLSLAAYGMVVHRETPLALRAARLYIAFAMVGELAFFAAIALIQAEQGTRLLPTASAVSPPGPAVWLMLVGFGIKAGLLPLHLWLPLAHPAAPVPASAVLSGATLKAGLIGLATFAPPASPVPENFETAMTWLGLAGAFGAALYGSMQRDPKVVLAYSSVSQMGLALAFFGAARGAGLPHEAYLGALTLFAVHHALAKGALFLVVEPGLPRRAALAIAAVAGLALTGAPLTAGYLSKSAFAAGLPETLAALFTAASFGTAALVARTLWLLHGKLAGSGFEIWRAMGCAVLAAGVLATPWLWDGAAALTGPRAAAVALLPAVVLLMIGWAVLRAGLRAPDWPAGDLVLPAERVLRGALVLWRGAVARLARLPGMLGLQPRPGGAATRVEIVEDRDERAMWTGAGVGTVVVLIGIVWAVLTV